MGLPTKLKNFNIHLNGTSHIGQASEVTLPKLAIKTEGWRGGGMVGEIAIDQGMDKLECEFTLGGFALEAIRQFGATAHDAVMLRFAGAYQDDTTGAVVALEAVVRGRYMEIDMGGAKPGGDTEHKAKIACSYYRLVWNGRDLVEIDLLNSIFIVDGVDRYAEIRAAIGS